jgi:hypothetical protein
MERATVLEKSPDFSLVLGGPLFQMFRRAHLSGPHMELLWRRIWTISLLAWLPLLVLSALGGQLVQGSSPLPFSRDIEAHVRFLIALPILIGAELIVHLRIRTAVSQFLERRIIAPGDHPKFQAAIQSAMRIRNSPVLELALLVLVYTVGHLFWRRQVALGTGSWYAVRREGGLDLTTAGLWYAFVSIPIFQFIWLRWYLRLFIWFRFLWQVSRLNLHLISTHPDRAGGIRFLGNSTYAFGPILFAQGALLAGLIASQVLYGGKSLLSFKMDAAGLIGFFVVFLLAPLIFFTPKLARTKREGLREYGLLATGYVDEFERKWVKSPGADDDELLGSGDIQSLADLGNSYTVVKEMQVLPFGLQDAVRLAVTTAVPLVPLGLTIFSLEELVLRLAKIVL